MPARHAKDRYVLNGPSVGGAAALAAAALLLLAASPAQGQQRQGTDLGQLYQRARGEALMQRHMRESARALPPVQIGTSRLDSLRARLGLETDETPLQEGEAPLVALPPVQTWRAVRRLARPVFEERFEETDWAYLGANGRTLLDTMQTRRLRARLQALYGDPTLAAVDTDSLMSRSASEHIQFAYWFIINDASSSSASEEAFPVRILDTGGPFDRGLVFAAPARFQARLPALRDSVLAPLVETTLRARYVDYYYERDTDTWYRAGFDGRRFFARPVSRSEVIAGQRPALPSDP